MSRNSLQKQLPDPNLYPRPKPVAPVCQADQVCIDPDNILDYTSRDIFSEITKKYAQVFSSKPGLYNGALGNLDAHLVLNDNVEPPSFPSRKIVQSEKLDRIKQSIMDEMEADGILVRPEDHGIHVTHVHDSYLVPKTEDGVATGEYRLTSSLYRLTLNQHGFHFQLLRNHSENWGNGHSLFLWIFVHGTGRYLWIGKL